MIPAIRYRYLVKYTRQMVKWRSAMAAIYAAFHNVPIPTIHISYTFGQNRTHLDIRTLELGLQDAVAREARHMEAIAVRIADENVASIGNIDAVREAGDLLVTNAMHERAVLAENGHVVALEVAHVEVGACCFRMNDIYK